MVVTIPGLSFVFEEEQEVRCTERCNDAASCSVVDSTMTGYAVYRERQEQDASRRCVARIQKRGNSKTQS